jgi:RNA-directed DNA polymerase
MGGGSQPIPNANWAPVQFVLTVPTTRDRVVQTAATLVLEPIFEADFDEAAYGYRPKRSALDAVQAVHHAINEGHTEIVDADLSRYLDAAS